MPTASARSPAEQMGSRKMNEAESIINKLRSVKTMAELDELRKPAMELAVKDGTDRTFRRIQRAFLRAKNRLRLKAMTDEQDDMK